MLFTATSAIVLALALAKSSHALDNGLGFTPAMGWNSWNLFACDINENITITIAEALIAKGLDKVGYKYVNLDDCWQLSRDNDGYIVVDDRTFPNGMKYLADYMHARDLKFGLYSSAGTYTCQGRPGSLRYEKEDAISYASWDVDYLKLDNCYNEGWGSKEGTIYRYGKMRDALNATGRPIYYSLCNWGESRSWEYGMELGNAWRTTGDICDSYQGRDCAVMNLLDDNVDRVQYSAPGGFSDLDMLEVGNGGMTLAEYRSHFSAWVVTKSPLLLGNDIRTMSDELVDLVSNTEVIAINQDPLGIAARRVLKSQKFTVNAMGEEDEEFLDVWTGPLQGGERVLMVLNRGETKVEKFAVDLNAVFFNDGLERNLTAPQPDFYIDENKVLRPMNATSNSKGRRVRVRNLWTKKNAGFATDVVEIDTIAAHDVVMLRIVPASASEWMDIINPHVGQSSSITFIQVLILTSIFALLGYAAYRAYVVLVLQRDGQIRLE